MIAFIRQDEERLKRLDRCLQPHAFGRPTLPHAELRRRCDEALRLERGRGHGRGAPDERKHRLIELGMT